MSQRKRVNELEWKMDRLLETLGIDFTENGIPVRFDPLTGYWIINQKRNKEKQINEFKTKS